MRLQTRVSQLDALSLDHRELAAQACQWVAEAFDTRLIVWTTLDPVTLLPTSLHVPLPTPLSPFAPDAHLAKKFCEADVDRTRTLSVGWLLGAPGHVGAASRLGQEARDRILGGMPYRVFGMQDELRGLFTHNDDVWGAISICRRRVFTDQEIATMAEVGPLLGDAIRCAFLRAVRWGTTGLGAGPGLIRLGPDDTPIEVDARARELLGDEHAAVMPVWLHVLVQKARAGEGRSMVLSTGAHPISAHLTSFGGQPVVVLQPSQPPVLASWLVRAYGLTDRQRQVVECICKGWSTRKIAFELDIADATVKRHVEAVFQKLGVRRREEVVHELLTRHYLPMLRQKATPSPEGWFMGGPGVMKVG